MSFTSKIMFDNSEAPQILKLGLKKWHCPSYANLFLKKASVNHFLNGGAYLKTWFEYVVHNDEGDAIYTHRGRLELGQNTISFVHVAEEHMIRSLEWALANPDHPLTLSGFPAPVDAEVYISVLRKIIKDRECLKPKYYKRDGPVIRLIKRDGEVMVDMTNTPDIPVIMHDYDVDQNCMTDIDSDYKGFELKVVG